jgi:phosphohistidine phosphatase
MAEQVWLLRHGEAEPHGARVDDDRELTDRGREQSRAAGRALAATDVRFHTVYTSPKLRALDTAKLACETLGCDPVVHEPLRVGFGVDDLPELVLGGEDERILLVGHEPDFSQLVYDLTGARVAVKKGGVVGIRMEGARRGELIVLLRPRELVQIAG